MFLSAQYTVYSSAHPLTDAHPRAEVRILPKSLYGKNAPSATVPHAFFSHFYGSSWHDDDAGFVTFLGAWGKKLMYVGGVVILLGTIRLAYVRWTGGSNQQYQPLPILPISAFMGGTQSGSTTPTGSSGTGSTSLSPTLDQLSIPGNVPSDIASAFRRAGNLILAVPASLIPGDRRQTGLLYFVPTMFQSGPSQRSRARTSSEASQFPLRTRSHREHVAPPPYDDPPSDQRDETMDEVDAFLKDSDASSRSTERASDVTVKEAEWPEWKKDVQN